MSDGQVRWAAMDRAPRGARGVLRGRAASIDPRRCAGAAGASAGVSVGRPAAGRRRAARLPLLRARMSSVAVRPGTTGDDTVRPAGGHGSVIERDDPSRQEGEPEPHGTISGTW